MKPEVRFDIMIHMLKFALGEFEAREGKGFFDSLAYDHMKDSLNLDLSILRETMIKGFPGYPTDVTISKLPETEEETMFYLLTLIRKASTCYKENDTRGVLNSVVGAQYVMSILVKFEKAYKK